MITATELLKFLCFAQKLSILDVTFRQTDEGYYITLRDEWHNDGKWYNKTLFINNENESTWENGDYDFYTMNDMFDEKLEELIESLTPEQRELLGV